MKSLILLISLFFLNFSNESYSEVYICNSKSSKKYHYKKECRGLNACKQEVVSVKKSQAQDLGLSLCGWED